VMAGYAMDNQNVTGTTTASMTGSGYSIKAFGDLPISGSLGVIARTGLEQVNFTGTTGTINRQTAILYYTGDLLLRYSFSDRGFMPYIGGGLGLHYPISKSSDILNPDRIATTFVFFIPSVGFNMQMSNSMILTAVAEYAMFPPSSEVSTYFYTVRAGVGWKF
jgi:opacity protein-like surface antigen